VLRKVPSGDTQHDIRERMRKLERSLEIAEGKSDRRRQADLRLDLDALDLAYEGAAGWEPPRTKPKPVAEPSPGEMARVLRLVEAGRAHSLAVALMSRDELGAAERLVGRGLLRRMAARGTFPDRYVVTASGSHELGSFDSDDLSFHDDAWEAGARAREARARKPAGYGSEVASGKRKGQLVMFNPSPQSGVLTNMGKLTVLELPRGRVLAWNLRDAPTLSYDADGRLFIVYAGKVVRPSTSREIREYERTHWGSKAAGQVRAGTMAPPPFVSLGPAVSITYTTRKGSEELIDWVHPFGEGSSRKCILPTLVEHACKGGCSKRCAARGSIALHGGSYTVTERGIVG
jgi:hypothetical protein